MTYSRTSDGKFAEGTEQPHGFKKGHAPWNKGLGGKICPNCGVEFHRPGRKFCSKECYYEWQRINRSGENNPNWKGGKAKNIETIKNWIKIRRNIKKQKIVDQLGGKCTICGYDKFLGALEFHHLDPSVKEHNISAMFRFLWDQILEELEKCTLLCANCHREVHGGI